MSEPIGISDVENEEVLTELDKNEIGHFCDLEPSDNGEIGQDKEEGEFGKKNDGEMVSKVDRDVNELRRMTRSQTEMRTRGKTYHKVNTFALAMLSGQTSEEIITPDRFEEAWNHGNENEKWRKAIKKRQMTWKKGKCGI